MKERSKTLSQIADGLMALRSALNPSKHQFVWDEISFFADDIRRLESDYERTVRTCNNKITEVELWNKEYCHQIASLKALGPEDH